MNGRPHPYGLLTRERLASGVMEQVRTDQRPGPRPVAEPEKVRIAIELVERAELYVVAAAEVGLSDGDRRRELESLRAETRAVRDFLHRPYQAG